MANTVSGVVREGRIVPSSPLPEGAHVEIRVTDPLIESTPPSKTNAALVDEKDCVNIDKFDRLAAEWKSQSEFLPSPTAIADLPAYRAIIEMGWAAVPLILSELRREPDHWFVALKRITGEDPVPVDARGEMDRMAEAWLNWGRAHGFGGYTTWNSRSDTVTGLSVIDPALQG